MLALNWSDVDLEAPEVFFNKNLQNLRGRLHVKTTKTPKGRRRVPLTRGTAANLLGHRPAGWAPSDLVFPGRQGGFVRFSNLNRRFWQPLRAEAGLPDTRFHDLRHTCATLLLLANVHPKVVSERLGHSRIEITLNTYSHLLPGMQTPAVTALYQVQ